MKLEILKYMLLLALLPLLWISNKSVGPGLAIIGLLFVLWYIQSDVRAIRLRQREKANACVACGYSLTGNVSGVCPECGRKVE